MKTKISIEEYINEYLLLINQSAAELEKKFPDSSVILGRNNTIAEGRIFKIKKHLDLCNQVFIAWLTIFPGKQRSLNTWDEVLSFMKGNASEAAIELRKKYVIHNKIEIPKHFKIEKVVFSIDYPNAVETAFDSITSLFQAWNASALMAYGPEHWNTTKAEFEMTEGLKQQIFDSSEVKSEHRDLKKAGALALIAAGLNMLGDIVRKNEFSESELLHGNNLLQQSAYFRKLVGIAGSKLKSDAVNYMSGIPHNIEIDWDATLHGRFDRTQLNPMKIRFGKSIEPDKSKQEMGTV